MSTPEVVITHALRTPIGRFLGSLQPLSAVDLGIHVVRGVLEQAGVSPGEVDEVILGHGRQVGSGPNPARQVAVRAGLPVTCPAITLNRACASGLQAIWQARQIIALGEASIVVAGGMESMSNMPFLLPDMRTGYRLGHQKVVDAMYRDGFDCPLAGMPMGMTAEHLADEYQIPRGEQDEYALRSFQRWQAAEDAGRLDAERLPIELTDRKGKVTLFAHDEHPRRDVTLADLARLPPVFRPDGGTVHAGNASGITDGAAALLVMTRETAEQRDLPVLATLGCAKLAGVDPRSMGIGPVPAVRDLCWALDKTVDDFDLIELNEAFAAQVIACDRDLNLPADRLNVNGGAIAIGHPIGCTGARIVVTLLHEMQRRDARLGLATLCVSGGMGMAVSLHR